MTPLQAYTQKIHEKTLQPDPYQEMAMQYLQQIYASLLSTKKWMTLKKKKPCKGLYLWGEVGRGKTQLMDLFYKHLPVPKLRLHFYQFMHDVHRALTHLQGKVNPLNRIANDLAHTAKVICLDEFLVHEIADAMLLSQLLHALFQQGIILVTTANTPPDALYPNGLQRELFLTAITQIKQHLTIFHLDSPYDYRLYSGIEKNSFDNPVLTMTMTLAHIQHLFITLNKGKKVSYQPLSIHGRLIYHHGYTDDTVWFNFTSICTVPRSQIDYLDIAKRFSTVLISDIKPIGEQDDNLARLFIHLVDIFYDAGIKLILISETTIIELYPKGRFFFEFQRTKSRLIAFQKKALRLITKLSLNNSP
ncbi:MAG: cell division protein ZapE [Pseudomonadota bacterium]